MSFWNPFRRSEQPNEAGQASEIKVVVKWNKDRFNIPVPKPAETPLSTLVATLSSQTGLSADKIKLIYNGGVMKNMSVPLAGYGLKDGSMIVLVGSNDPPAAGVMGAVREQQVKKKKEEIPTTEEGLVEFLAGKRKFVEDMKPELDVFEKDCQAYLSPKGEAGSDGSIPAAAPTWQKLQQAHARITEVLLQHLLKLDGIEIQSSMTKARAERKEAVRVVQREMDCTDAVWAKVRDQKA